MISTFTLSVQVVSPYYWSPSLILCDDSLANSQNTDLILRDIGAQTLSRMKLYHGATAPSNFGVQAVKIELAK